MHLRLRYHPLLRHILPIAPILFALVFMSCKDGLYVSFLFQGTEKYLQEIRKNVEIRLHLIAGTLLEDELQVVNNSNDTAYIDQKDIIFVVPGRSIAVPIEPSYDRYLMKFNSKATMICNESSDNYHCVDAITSRTDLFTGKGFSFGQINPGESRTGYLSFAFPSPVNDAPSTEDFRNELKKHAFILRGEIRMKLTIGETEEPVIFPMEVRLYDNLRDTRYDIKSLLK